MDKKSRGPAKGLPPRTCHCGTEFQPYRENAIHCSPACKNKGPWKAKQSRKRRATPEGKAKAAEYSKRTREKNPDKYQNPETWRAWNLQKNHGLTVEEYDEMLAAQGGTCAMCQGGETVSARVKNLCIDHDHDCCPQGRSCTACRRGLLCSACNRGIGYLRDDPLLMERGAAYVRSYL